MIDYQVCDLRFRGALIVAITDFDSVGIGSGFKYVVILLCEMLIEDRNLFLSR